MEILKRGVNRVWAGAWANPDTLFTALAVTMTIIAVATIPEVAEEPLYKETDGLGTALVVLSTASLAFVRRWPMPAFVILISTLVTQAALTYPIGDVEFFASLVVVFVATYYVRAVRSVAVLMLTMGTILALYLLDHSIQDIPALWINFAIFAAAWFSATLLRSRVARIAQVESYAAELSVQSELVAQEAVADERSRIARELHDAVGHTLNLIVVQAGAAKRVRNSNPNAAFDALNSIENTGRQALADMDRMLGVLREGPETAGGGRLGPRPGLARLDVMLDEARSAGIELSLEVSGEERKLPVSIDLTAYRIVQEAITNVIKHAPGAKASVRLDYGPRALGLDIQNGPAKAAAGNSKSGGRGLPGMQERVALFGGSIKYGPLDNGGFKIQVSLPIGEAA